VGALFAFSQLRTTVPGLPDGLCSFSQRSIQQ
jgi:hypothetical protein